MGYFRVRTPRLGTNPTSRLLPAALEEFAAPALREAQQRKGNVARMYAMIKHTSKFFCLFEIAPHRLGTQRRGAAFRYGRCKPQPLSDCFCASWPDCSLAAMWLKRCFWRRCWPAQAQMSTTVDIPALPRGRGGLPPQAFLPERGAYALHGSGSWT